MAQPTHVAVVGGGFAGVACTRRLCGEADVKVTLVDRLGYHQFQPLLYQVATAELGRADVAFPQDQIFHRHPNVTVRRAEVVDLDQADRVRTRARSLFPAGVSGEGASLVVVGVGRPGWRWPARAWGPPEADTLTAGSGGWHDPWED